MSVSRNTPNAEQTELLHDLYYNQNVIFGRDRLYKYVQEFYPEYNISRRMVWNFLSKQETHQRFAPQSRADCLSRGSSHPLLRQMSSSDLNVITIC